MAATNYPTIANLQAYLNELSLGTTFSTLTLQAAIDDGVQFVESRCNRIFTTSDTSETRYFDCAGPQTVACFAEIDDCWSLTSVSASNQLLTLNLDYVVRPGKTGVPVEAIEFLTIAPFGSRTVKVIGKFGWQSVPSVIQQAIIKAAAASILATQSVSEGGTITSQRLGDRQVQYAEGMNGAGVLRKEVERLIQPYILMPYV